MPFYFYGVFENISKEQKEEKIKIEFKAKFLCPYGCRRSHKPNQEETLEKNLWCSEKDCQLYDFEKRGHKQAREKLRPIIKCPSCFERIFPIGIDAPKHANYDQWVQKQFREHKCPGQDSAIIWQWRAEENPETMKRKNKKEAARARREKFADIQKARKKAVTEGKNVAEASSQLHRKYHSYQQLKAMNNIMTKHQVAAEFAKEQEDAETASANDTMNPAATPRNEREKRTYDSAPGTEELKAAFRQKGKGKGNPSAKGNSPFIYSDSTKGGRGSNISPTNLSADMAAVAMDKEEDPAL